jgi:hypothetical protein
MGGQCGAYVIWPALAFRDRIFAAVGFRLGAPQHSRRAILNVATEGAPSWDAEAAVMPWLQVSDLQLCPNVVSGFQVLGHAHGLLDRQQIRSGLAVGEE